jgi:hypothetical protein
VLVLLLPLLVLLLRLPAALRAARSKRAPPQKPWMPAGQKGMQNMHHKLDEDEQQHKHILCRHTITAHQHAKPLHAQCHPRCAPAMHKVSYVPSYIIMLNYSFTRASTLQALFDSYLSVCLPTCASAKSLRSVAMSAALINSP